MKENIFTKLQQHVRDILNADEELSSLGITVLAENILDIDYQIKQAMQKQGLVVLVMFQNAEYEGAYEDQTQAWSVNDCTVQVVENPTIWRAILKKLGKSNGTTLDILSRISDILSSPKSETYGKFTSRQIDIGEDNGLIVGKYTFSTTIFFKQS